MQYFRDKYPGCHFVVASDDHYYVMSFLGKFEDVMILPLELSRKGAATDLATLSLCDHMIISVGTFSFWAGWMVTGEVVYHDAEPHYFKERCKVPDTWIPME